MATTKRKTSQKPQPAKKKESGQSQFSLFIGKATFTGEPLWYRLTVILIIVLSVLVLGWILKEWALPAIGKQILFPKLGSWINNIKGRGP